MPKIKVDIKEFIKIRETSETKAEIIQKTGYPASKVDSLLRACNQAKLTFSKPLKRSRDGINWAEAREYLKSLQK